MRVLHIFYEIKYSGAEIMYANAAPLFQENGIKMIALSTGKNVGEFLPHFQSANIEVFHKPLLNGTKNPITIFNYFKDIYLFLKVEQIDLIHIHRAPYYWFFALVGYLSGKKIVRTVHNVFTSKLLTWPKAVLDRFISRRIFGVKFQTIGESVYNHELNYFKNESIRINNWYDETKFYPQISAQEKHENREKLGIPLENFVIISTGACSDVKNHYDIIKALSIVNHDVPCTYLHLGSGVTENEEEALAYELGVHENIKFLGNRLNVRDFIIASDVFVMTSKFEGLSIASIEAMACGLPSVLYNSPGLRDLIRDDNNGFLIESNYKLLAKKIVTLARDQDLAQLKGKNARLFVTKYFSIKKGVKEIIEKCYC